MAKSLSETRVLRVALLGAETLLAHEVLESLKPLEGIAITSFAGSGEGAFGEEDGEAVYFEPLDAKAIKTIDVILAAGSAEGAMKAYSLAKPSKGRLVVIDCGGHLEQEPEARIVSLVPGDNAPAGAWLLVTAHPAAAAIANTLQRLSRFRAISRAVVNVFEPASEHGKAGAAELQQQISSLLAFRPLEKKIFDAQLGFNLLPRLGAEAPVKLEAIERRIEKHVASLLRHQSAGPVKPLQPAPPPPPSVRLIQAPVFHAYSISFWVEFSGAISVTELGEALASAQIEVRGPDEEAPDGVAATGQSGLIAGDIRIDRNNPSAAWLWVVCDNLRMTGDAAAALLSSLKTAKV